MAGVLAQTGLVDHALRMLDAETDGKRLGFDMHALAMQHTEGVAGAVTQGQHHMAAAKCLAIGQHHAFELAILDHEIGDPGLEAYLAAEGDDFLAHRGNHAGKAEGADMRLADVHDLFRRAARTNSCITLRA